MNGRLLKVISGGQTGVDRAALDAALDAGYPCGGVCPRGRRAEDGAIPLRYPMTESASARYGERTRRNVDQACATVVIHFGRLEGGSALTVHYGQKVGKPVLVLDGEAADAAESIVRLVAFCREHQVRVLNVAGPRDRADGVVWLRARDVVRGFLDAWDVRVLGRVRGSTAACEVRWGPVVTPWGRACAGWQEGLLCALLPVGETPFCAWLVRRFPGARCVRDDALAQAFCWERPGRLFLLGTSFQVQVWRALCTLRPGERVAYGEVACRIGRPEAVRAVARATGENPVAFLVPCHRVVRRAGRGLGGYAWGLDLKERLLKEEEQAR